MSLSGFKATNHPQQTAKRAAVDAVDDRGTDQAFFDSLSERFGGFDIREGLGQPALLRLRRLRAQLRETTHPEVSA